MYFLVEEDNRLPASTPYRLSVIELANHRIRVTPGPYSVKIIRRLGVNETSGGRVHGFTDEQ